MAKAGFVYTPQATGDDTASCFYCGVALSGWDEDDDPMEEHHKREVEDEVDGSENEVGKRVSKSKSKGPGNARGRIEVIEEEEENDKYEEEESKPVEKRKRGRPPGKAKKTVTKTKKTPTEKESVHEDTDIELPPAPPRSAHAKSRLTVDVDSDRDVPIPSSSKTLPTGSKTSLSTKARVKNSPVVEVLVPSVPHPKRKDKTTGSDPLSDIPLEKSTTKVKDTAVSRTKSKSKAIETESDDPSQAAPYDDYDKPVKRSSQGIPRNVDPKDKMRKSSTTSDDAGYATAQHHMDVEDAMDVDNAAEPASSATSSIKNRMQPENATTNGNSIATNGDAGRRTVHTSPPHTNSLSLSKPAAKELATKAQIRSSSRPLARTVSRTGVVEVVDVSSDDEPMSIPAKPSLQAPDRPKSANGIHPPNDPIIITGKAVDVRDIGGSRQPSLRTTPEVVPRTSQATIQVDQASPSTLLREEAEEDIVMRDLLDIEESVPQSETQPLAGIDDADERAVGFATPPPSTPSISPTEIEPPALPAPTASSLMEEDGFPLDDSPASSIPSSFTPFLSMVTMHKLPRLTEEESNMTIEQFIRREIENQYQQFKRDGERRIAAFLEQAAGTKRTIEAA
ncbi:hypothetical protein EW026_g5340 [Hermanssonia centrifuga]|uniref:Uncharacterized protein n=1 Tax=Hermanssonia centrifuga TaxID=98765 RepID=A0A4S4KFE0_9APHY|nr:hypothetical protein EW026_g5340 [Hermanssonia centrifuga]